MAKAGRGSGRKQSYPALLPDGKHMLTMMEFRNLCVDGFPLSIRRAKLMTGLEQLVDSLVDADVECELWIDGSFLTKKINPGDIDLVIVLRSYFADRLNDEQDNLLTLVLYDGLFVEQNCDISVFTIYPERDPRHPSGENWHGYYMDKWSHNWDRSSTGFVVLQLAGLRWRDCC